MATRSIPGAALLRSLVAAVFVTGALSVPVHAQAPAAASKSLANLDVCENAATGTYNNGLYPGAPKHCPE